MNRADSSYMYSHGISEIYQGPVVYSSELTPSPIGNGWYEALEHEYIAVPTGTRVLVRKVHKNGVHFHYVTTKIDYGWVRRVVVFRDGETNPYVCDKNVDI